MKNNLKTKALELRANGCSFREISERLEISKSTASLWARNVQLNISARDRMLNLGDIGREKAVKTKK
jgi:orotate phosphoribosyltransferase-like protein